MFIKLNSKKGFTLVEIMIVVAIIGLLSAIAIPSLLRSRVNANESAAKATLRTLSTALESFRAAQTVPTYPANLRALTRLVSNPAYIDDNLGGAVTGVSQKTGYTFQYVPTNQTFVSGQFVFLSYGITAVPQRRNITGNQNFWVDESGVIRFNGPTGPAIEG